MKVSGHANYIDTSEYNHMTYEYPEDELDYNNFPTDYRTDDEEQYDEFIKLFDPHQYEDFHTFPMQNHPPSSVSEFTKIEIWTI